MELTEDVYTFEIPRPDTLPPYTNSEAYPPFETVEEPLGVHVVDGERTVLFDVGFAGAVHKLIDRLNRFDGPDVIVITHSHPDHYDALRVLTEVYDAPVAAPAADAHRLVEDVAVVPDITIGEADDCDLAWGETRWGVRAIHLPGHTPGHTAFLHEDSGTVIAADAVVSTESFVAAPGQWSGPLAPCIQPPVSDYRRQCESVQTLAEYDFDRLLLTHGPNVTTDASAAVDTLVADLDGYGLVD